MTAGSWDFGYGLPKLFDLTTVLEPHRRRTADPYAQPYHVPRQQVHEAPELVQQLHDLAQMAKWTNRQIGEIIGVSHPTVAQAMRGNAGALSRSVAQRQRLGAAHNVVSRIFLLASRDPHRTSVALDTPEADNLTAIDHLVDGQITKAYLAAARALRPPRIGDMMTGMHPLDARTATVAVLDED